MLKHVIQKQLEMRGEADQAHELVLQMICQCGTSSINYFNLLWMFWMSRSTIEGYKMDYRG